MYDICIFIILEITAIIGWNQTRSFVYVHVWVIKQPYIVYSVP